MPNTVADDLHSRFIQVEQAVKRLKDGADDVRATLTDTKYYFEWPSILLVELISIFLVFF